MKDEKKLWELIEDLNIKGKFNKESLNKDGISSNEKVKLNENDGFIEVRDQQLFVIDPTEDGKQPLLLPNPDLHILVNGQVLSKERIVFSQDEIEFHKRTFPPSYTIKVSDDKLAVFLRVNPELFQTFQLRRQKRANRVKLELEAVPTPCDVEEVSSEIMEEIMKKGIKVGINTTVIIQELINPTFQSIKVAEGLPLIPGVDSILESYFSEELKEVIEEVDGKTDYKDQLKIPSVEAGQVIAKLFPGKEGKEGYNVYGESLQPKRPEEIEIRSKPRVRVTEDGKVIALQAGRPSITGRAVKHIDILETYEVNSDVDMKTGNIYFSGDVIVRGHVKDNMAVECSGSIYVYGNVYRAKLTATQNIYIMGTVINSKVIAGQLSMFYSQIYKLSQSLSISMQRLIQAITQLETSLKEKKLDFDFSHVVSTLMEMKFSHIIKEVQELYDIFHEMTGSQIQLSGKFRIFLNSLSKFKNIQSVRTIQAIGALDSIQYSINDLIVEMESMVDDESSIKLKSANVSTIKTNGKIIVENEGVIQSHLFAGISIIFNKKDSVIRGGKLEALKSIKAGIVGTELGEVPELYAGEVIEIEKLYQCNIKLPYYNQLIYDYGEKLKFVYDPKSNKVKRI